MDQQLVDIPLQIETERLILRAPNQTKDAKLVNLAIKESFHELKEWLPFAQELPTIEETEINLRNAHGDFLKRRSFRFLIFDKNNNNFIGVTSLEKMDWTIPKCEIGYWIHTKFGGHGYMLEAVSRLVALGLDIISCRRIEIRCESTNLKSRAIPEKLGFIYEGTLKNDDLSADGRRLTDTCVYSKIQ